MYTHMVQLVHSALSEWVNIVCSSLYCFEHPGFFFKPIIFFHCFFAQIKEKNKLYLLCCDLQQIQLEAQRLEHDYNMKRNLPKEKFFN